MYYMDANWMYGEKAWRELHKNAASNIEQVLEAASHKAAAVRPPTTHHEPDMRGTAGEVRTNSLAIDSCGPLHMEEQRQDNRYRI